MCEESGHLGCRDSTGRVTLQKMTLHFGAEQFGPLYKGSRLETTARVEGGDVLGLFGLAW